ncbi:MAG TPA: CopD family protein [Crocinitomix sp.]|nr:CopD family protein [Crocinitomix sp.]
MEYYNILKALHIIFIVTWFAGLFYVVRLFIYHTETKSLSGAEKDILQKQYKIMTSRLWNIITWPSAIITLIIATLLLNTPLGVVFLKQPWMWIKLSFVFLLYLYHFACHLIYKQLQNNQIKYSSHQLRIWNEIATIILFSVVFLITLKTTLGWIFGVVGIIGLIILLMLGIKLYNRIRKR